MSTIEGQPIRLCFDANRHSLALSAARLSPRVFYVERLNKNGTVTVAGSGCSFRVRSWVRIPKDRAP